MPQLKVRERTALYKFYDASGRLLYVGITRRLGSRWGEHAKAQPWWLQVDHQTVRWFPDRDEAAAAEKTAIGAEGPVFNVVGSLREGWGLDEETGFYVGPRRTQPSARNYDDLPSIYQGDGWQWPRERVAGLIERGIASGEYAPGVALPSQDRIAREAGVSKTTVNAAIRLLCERGILFTRPDRGTFVVGD